jgi:thiamine kinase-like enzyme
MTETDPEVGITLFGIEAPQSGLIRRACTDAASNIRLDTLDKGLSGARVLLAQWPLQANIVSAQHVFKIGELSKLRREAERTEKFISPVDPQLGHIRLFEDEANNLALLRQAFLGSPDGKVTSLKEWIREEKQPKAVTEKIELLYCGRMRQWHCVDHCVPPREAQTLKDAFVGRIARQIDLGQAFDAVGRKALEESFAEQKFATLAEIESVIPRLNDTREELPIGLTHGDLHAQNILVSEGGLQLIDFAWASYGWKAVDFLMLECSLKLLVVPAECRLEDLLYLEALLDTGTRSEPHFPELEGRPYAQYLLSFASALNAVRMQALSWKSVTDFEQYRRGLVVLMSCLGTYPGLNRNFLAHSLAYHVSKLR